MKLLPVLILAGVYTSSLSDATPSLNELNDQQLAELSKEQLLQLILRSRERPAPIPTQSRLVAEMGSIRTTMA